MNKSKSFAGQPVLSQIVDVIRSSLINNKEYICAEILAANLDLVDRLDGEEAVNVEVDADIQTQKNNKKHNSVGLN